MEKNKIVGIFPMVGDLLHIGHVKAIEEAKKHCDYLIVALNCDPQIGNPNKNKPIESVYERFSRIKALKAVDEVIPYAGEDDLFLLLQTTCYQVRFVGADHLEGDWTGRIYEKENGIQFYAIPRSHSMSSSELRNRIFIAESERRKRW